MPPRMHSQCHPVGDGGNSRLPLGWKVPVASERRPPGPCEEQAVERKDWRVVPLRASNSNLVRPLPEPPAIRLVVHSDRSANARALGGFLDIRRLDLVAHYPDGTESVPFPYDVATRRALDAVIIAATYLQGGVRHVFLRSAVRPPCALRPEPPRHNGTLWELPAGLVEPGEDPAQAAARELVEELGFTAPAADLRALGEWTFPEPGMIGERHFFFSTQVYPQARGLPTEDGSVLERGAAILALPVDEVLQHCRLGHIRDAKTELALRRLVEVLP